ncbi:DUF1700 domain-containing protein [Saccharibacillus sp. O23]|uniref:DUF1700 domain-containing protein n=1 Tax=Saccharibacillus sp. O23 TaxID=2009338 RepID=UPI0015C619EE|nr:DUF1700 domain-containing protein [Saccharibacillus sp. O23]
MNKEQFLFRLQKGLAVLPSETRKELMADYEDHFRSGLEHGKSEEEIAFELGSPEELAQEALELQPKTDGHAERAATARADVPSSGIVSSNAGPKRQASFSFVRLVLSVLWNLIAVPLWVSAWALAAGLAAVVLALLASPLLFAADFALNRDWNTAQFYAVLLMLGIGIWVVGPFLDLLRFVARSTGRYALWNARFVMGRN